MTWGNNGPAGVNTGFGVSGAGQPYPPYYGAGFQSVLAAMSAGALPANIQPTGASSLGTGNPTLLQSIGQGLPLNGTNGVQAPVNNSGGGPIAAVSAEVLANVPSFSNPQQYGGA